ncbi:MAG: hypothetical protein QG650_850, partial [Patescibacteria group bacterium]|nr:hypothetical protein [Patescibacteria group bacterium]
DAYGDTLTDADNSMSGHATTETVYSGTVVWTGSSYYAANVSPTKLKIDGSKFFDKAGTTEKPFVMASVTVSENVNNKTRLRSVFQVAGTLNNAGSETALVEGTYATGAGPTDIDGLINAYDWTTGVAKPVTAGGVNLPYSLK